LTAAEDGEVRQQQSGSQKRTVTTTELPCSMNNERYL